MNVSASASVNVDTTSTIVGTNSQLDEEDFLMLLITELSNQDPLAPLDDSEFIAQMAQLNTLSETIQVNENLQTVQMLQATSLVGHEVQAIGPNGEQVEGTVTEVWFIDSQPYLVIDNDIVVSLDYVATIA
ncbi:MAG: flagellar hook capping protein [Candidatus Abyssobacteria bacterium SURF_17]|jgi:flagellar basal-body rod modification protein FlgD|uniref:Basal-body rod modification protein FlgD n=1 Tax=Candidatus Abyssobacteria bacterium SURF_17 TaxID=2093361 RepID=A0A419F4G5_9BACT|nr:MAG: flagellar hook capping protein [Candidatus Abyssubacteria bacterium SURF_17]